MFCSKCGKPVNDGSLFCTFCGNPVTESAPQSVPIQSTPAAPVETPAPLEAGTPAAAVATEVQDVELPPVSDQQGSPVSEQPVSPVPEIIEQLMHPAPEANSALPTEKYYTFGHLALCLAAVALMAIVAGVFAGLYFSVR